uniref:RNase III domain-containing protein n=1 Tax=Araucaria cunninghamii TaxID=56994 RepID=A0A0D6R0H8_ARACU
MAFLHAHFSSLSMDTLHSSLVWPLRTNSSGYPSSLTFSHPTSWVVKKSKKTRWALPRLKIYAVTTSPSSNTENPSRSPQRLLQELEEMKARERTPRQKYKLPPKTYILKTPMDDKKLAQRFLKSPQLSLKSFPLLSSCLPSSHLGDLDKAWMEDNLLEAKQALGYPLEALNSIEENSPAAHFDTLLYLAFQHEESERAKKSRYVRVGHSRLAFLGQFALSLALAEYFLQRYPREGPACLRERVFGLTNKRVLPYWIKVVSLDNLIFPYDEITKMKRYEREPAVKQVFLALMGAIYLCFGTTEIYRVLFEVFGMDPDAEDCQPKARRQLEDIDYVSSEFEGKQLTWQDIVAYKRPADALFAYPRLYRVCVPPGLHKFRGNIWEVDSLPQILQALGYPLPMSDTILEATEARNIELGLGLQLCFLHPSKYKFEHPRFCFERFEYVGQNIQDIVMAERLLMKHLDAPGHWIQERHRRLLLNRLCGRYLREKGLHKFIIYGEHRKTAFEENRKLRNMASTAVQQALHGLAYTVYGKPEVRRLMFEYFDFEQVMPKSP